MRAAILFLLAACALSAQQIAFSPSSPSAPGSGVLVYENTNGALACLNSATANCILIPDVKFIPAANCVNAIAGSGWSLGASGVVACRAGTNNLSGYVSITDTAGTFAQFSLVIPEDWDTAINPSIRFEIASADTTTGHTIIPKIAVSCAAGNGSTTDDVTFNAAHSSGTITLNSTANQFWSNSNVQMNSTDMTGCSAGSLMIVQVGRATDTATSAYFYGANVTIPRFVALQAN